MPTPLFPPVTPLTCQVTAVLVVLVTVAVKDRVPPTWTLAVAGLTDTVMVGVVAGHVPLFAEAGAVVVAAVELTTTSAASCRPASSVTVRRIVYEPDAGATTIAVAVLAPWIGFVGLVTFVHAWLLIVWPQAAALPVPDSVTFWPGATVAGTNTAAIGR